MSFESVFAWVGYVFTSHNQKLTYGSGVQEMNRLWSSHDIQLPGMLNQVTRHAKLVGGFNPSENISQIGNLPQIGMKIENIWNQHLVNFGGCICLTQSIEGLKQHTSKSQDLK